PSHLIPTTYDHLPNLPLNTNGKIDLSALPVPRLSASSAGGSSPRIRFGDAVEEQVAQIWRDVLRTDALSLDDRLFDVGGASLQVAQIHESTVRVFGLAGLRLLDLFTHTTVRTYSAHIRVLQAGEQES
ncbi:phosphopantetheine-binding protein, partial [Streptomyces sp. NPDC051909]|uniref:phosphopantetheine-binding protein n=1 Tax=Streptomyces sp. NPDC051909 TaxID=3154944 RepID=UPI00343616AC